MSYALFDIGGTKTRVAISDDLRSFEAAEKFDTPMLFHAGMEAIIDSIDRLRQGRRIKGIAGGMRGPLNHEKTGIVSETKLKDWIGRPIVDTLHRKFDTHVLLENDAAIVALGEAHFGAGRGYEIVAYHTVSTGVGGARIVNGKIDVTATGFEPGHQVLDIDRSILGPNVPHTLENLVSGEALEKRRGVKPYEIPQSDAVWNELAGYLAKGLKTTILYWSPSIIVLGGSMIVGDPRILLQDIIRHTKDQLNGSLPCPPIVDAQLKDEGGLYGAMALLSQKLAK
jgi:predicted NBD/HSP70 family sugar kinase